MAGKKIKVTKKKGGKSKAWYNQKYSVTDIATKAYNTAMYLKDFLNCEKKKLDNVATSEGVDSTGDIICLNKVAAGNETYERSGNSILGKGIWLRFTPMYNSAGNTVQNIRVLIVRDKSCYQGQAPTVSEIFASTTSTQIMISPLSMDANGRFVVLFDRLFNLNANSPGRTYSKFIKFSTHQKFTNTAGTDYDKDSIFMIVVSNSTTNTPTYTYWARYYFYDN